MKNFVSATLSIILLIANAMFILITIKSLEDWQIMYNIVVISLNIIYYVLELIPEKEE